MSGRRHGTAAAQTAAMDERGREKDGRAMAEQKSRHWRTWVTGGLLVVLAGCTAQPGSGCTPTAEPPATTTPGSTTSTVVTTTTVATSSTTTTEPGSSTTTTVDPGGSTTTTSTTVPGGSGELVEIAEIDVEDCLTPVGDDVMVGSVELFDCDEPHEAEVFAQFDVDTDDLPDGADGYPGGSELTWYAQDECQSRFEDYTGESYWDSEFDLEVITPSFSTWDVGDRAVTCLLIDGDGGMLTRSGRSD